MALVQWCDGFVVFSAGGMDFPIDKVVKSLYIPGAEIPKAPVIIRKATLRINLSEKTQTAPESSCQKGY